MLHELRHAVHCLSGAQGEIPPRTSCSGEVGNILRPTFKLLTVCRRDTQHSRNDLRGQSPCKLRHKFHPAVRSRGINQFTRRLLDKRSQIIDHSRSERFGDERSQARMVRRIEIHQPRRVMAPEGQDLLLHVRRKLIHVRRESPSRNESRIPERRMHVAIACQKPAVEPVTPVDRIFTPQPAMDRIRIRQCSLTELLVLSRPAFASGCDIVRHGCVSSRSATASLRAFTRRT